MPPTCSKCSRVNPPEASFCYADGAPLAGRAGSRTPIVSPTQRFPQPFVFPSGLSCHTYEELAQACQQNWSEGRQLLRHGYLEGFLVSNGRADLALAAREAARFPDPDRALDQFLARLPSRTLKPPALRVEPLHVDLGRKRPGEDGRFEIHLKNQGMRLLYGTISCDGCPWLALGGGAKPGQKLFEFQTETIVPVTVRGQGLRARSKPLEGRLLIESNGGSATVVVNVEVPVTPFTQEVLAGAQSPRQAAEKARDVPKEAAILLETGAVAAWYRENGWTYPIQGPAATGLAAVQQFFEALGLAAAPAVEISDEAIILQGNAGEQLTQVLVVKSEEKRAIYAHGTSDQPWLQVERPRLHGRIATLPLTVPDVPNQPGQMLHARVTATANGRRHFFVPVTLLIGDGRRAELPPPSSRARRPPRSLRPCHDPPRPRHRPRSEQTLAGGEGGAGAFFPLACWPLRCA
jgi:hypothetical protein